MYLAFYMGKKNSLINLTIYKKQLIIIGLQMISKEVTEGSRVLRFLTVKRGLQMSNSWNDLDHFKVFYHSLPAQSHHCVRAHVWSQSACLEGLKHGNTYGSFGKLRQLAALRLQLHCSKGGVAHESIHPLWFCRHPCMCSLNEYVS